MGSKNKSMTLARKNGRTFYGGRLGARYLLVMNTDTVIVITVRLYVLRVVKKQSIHMHPTNSVTFV